MIQEIQNGLINKYPVNGDDDNDDNDDKKEEIKQKSLIPNKFVCPITKEMMKEPVIAFDGNSYEKNAIMEYLKLHKKSPLTNEETTIFNVFPNMQLKKEIEIYNSTIQSK